MVDFLKRTDGHYACVGDVVGSLHLSNTLHILASIMQCVSADFSAQRQEAVQYSNHYCRGFSRAKFSHRAQFDFQESETETRAAKTLVHPLAADCPDWTEREIRYITCISKGRVLHQVCYKFTTSQTVVATLAFKAGTENSAGRTNSDHSERATSMFWHPSYRLLLTST